MITLYKFTYNDFGPNKKLNPTVVEKLRTEYINSKEFKDWIAKTTNSSTIYNRSDVLPKSVATTDPNILSGFLGKKYNYIVKNTSGTIIFQEERDRIIDQRNGKTGLDEVSLVISSFDYQNKIEYVAGEGGKKIPIKRAFLTIKAIWRIKPRIAEYTLSDTTYTFAGWKDLPVYEITSDTLPITINISKTEGTDVFDLPKSLGVETYNFDLTEFDFIPKYFSKASSAGISLDMTGIYNRTAINSLEASADGITNNLGTNRSDVILLGLNEDFRHLTTNINDATTGRTFHLYTYELGGTAEENLYNLDATGNLIYNNGTDDIITVDITKDGYITSRVDDSSVTQYQRHIKFYLYNDFSSSKKIFTCGANGAFLYVVDSELSTNEILTAISQPEGTEINMIGVLKPGQIVELKYSSIEDPDITQTLINFPSAYHSLATGTSANCESIIRLASKVIKSANESHPLISGYYPSQSVKLIAESGEVVLPIPTLESEQNKWRLYQVYSGIDSAFVDDAGSIYGNEITQRNRIFLSINDSEHNGVINTFVEGETGEEKIKIENKMMKYTIMNIGGTDMPVFREEKPISYPNSSSTPDDLTNRIFLEIVRELVDQQIFSRNIIMKTKDSEQSIYYTGINF